MRTSNIFASYNADVVTKVLSSAKDSERKGYYESMGITLENCHDLETALKLSKLDYEVKKLPIYHQGLNGEYDFHQVPEMFATVRSDTGTTLGVVGKDYQVFQNYDAFMFLKDLVAIGDAKFETAGDLKRNGAASYITMSTEPIQILGDEFDPYIIISNGHDGKSCVRAAITPIRAICRNTAILSFKKASATVSIRHSLNMNDNLEKAKELLIANSNYLTALKEEAEKLALKPFSKEAFERLAHTLYPHKEDASETTQIRNLYMIERLMKAYKENDLANFSGSAWQALQSVSDVESHPTSWRKSSKVADAGTPEFQVVFNMMPMLNKAYEIIKESV